MSDFSSSSAVYAEECAVNRLDDDALVMDVDDFREGVAGRVILLLLGGQGLFDLFPVSLCGRHGVVAVADCVGEERLRVRAAVLRVEGLAVAQRLQTGLDGVGLRALRDKPAGDVAAVLHEVGVVQLGEGVGLGKERLDDLALGVVDQIMICGSSRHAPSRTFRRGGMRSTTVFSVGRMRDAEPGVYS